MLSIATPNIHIFPNGTSGAQKKGWYLACSERGLAAECQPSLLPLAPTVHSSFISPYPPPSNGQTPQSLNRESIVTLYLEVSELCGELCCAQSTLVSQTQTCIFSSSLLSQYLHRLKTLRRRSITFQPALAVTACDSPSARIQLP